jgi:hypothetical protein
MLCDCVGVYMHMHIPSMSSFEPADKFSRKFFTSVTSLDIIPTPYFKFPAVSRNNVADVRMCNVGLTVSSLFLIS